jgi:hypothetical protein
MLRETDPAKMIKQNGERELPRYDEANQFTGSKSTGSKSGRQQNASGHKTDRGPCASRP